MKEQDSQKPDGQSLNLIYRRTLLSSFGGGVINPFIHIFAAQMGASPIEMGWIRAINIVSGNIAQIPWGLAIDWLKRRTLFIFLGGLLQGLLLLPLIYVGNVLEFILVIASSFVFSAMVAPALNSLIGDLCEEGNRGRVFAQLNAVASTGSIPATVISGYVIYRTTGTLQEMYRIPVILSFLFGSMAAFIILKVREKPMVAETFTVKGWTKALRTNPHYRRLCFLSSGQGFFMAIAWPIFTLTIVRVVKADMFQISLLSVISGLTAIMARRFTGRLADRAGRKPLLAIGRGGLFLVPLIYAFASSIYELILVDFVIGILMASSDVALSAYLLDTSPRGLRGSYMGLFNALTGLFTFVGSITGGYFMDFLMSQGFGFQESMSLVYGVSASGRLIGGVLYVTLREPYRYPAKFREEMRRILKEEVERIKEEVETVEEMSERFKKIEDEDLEWFEKISSSKP